MAKGKTTRSSPATAEKRRTRRVWRISRYRQRFEMPDQWRRQMARPLEYARDFVGTNAGQEAAKYQQQIAMLGEGRNATLRFGLFRQLVGLASNQDRPYRGYLLDADLQPLTDAMLAKLLKWDLAELRKELKALVDAGLVERAVEPDYIAQDEADLPAAGDSEGENGQVRSCAATCGNVRAPFKKRVKRKSKQEKKSGIRDPEGSARRASGSQEASAEKVQGQSRKSPEPEKPESSKEFGGLGATGGDAPKPPAPAYRGRTRSVRLGDYLHWNDPESVDFGRSVYAALYGSEPPADLTTCSSRVKAEVGCFAAEWYSTRPGVPEVSRGELRVSAVQIAKHVRRYGKSARKPGAVWVEAFRDCVRKRAGPVAAAASG